MRSNLGVGPPIELLIYRTDALQLDKPHRFEEDSDFLRDLETKLGRPSERCLPTNAPSSLGD